MVGFFVECYRMIFVLSYVSRLPELLTFLLICPLSFKDSVDIFNDFNVVLLDNLFQDFQFHLFFAVA